MMTGRKPIKTIFYQGIYNSQVQLSKYLGPEGFIGTTGERVICDKGLPIIMNPFIGQEIDEIEPFENNIFNWLNPFKLFSYVFSYIGRVCNYIRIEDAASSSSSSSGQPAKAAFRQAASLKSHFINLPKFNFGQDGDLANHYNKYIQCVNEYPDHDLILWGVSKGAATTINALTRNNYDNSKIKMVVLEGCFTNIEEVFNHWVQNRSYFDSNYILARLFLWCLSKNILKYILNYQSKPDYNPINAIASLPHGIPIVFITCEADIVVPASQTTSLYERLKELGHPNVHLLKLKNSRHHGYMFDDENDRKAYETFINNLYKQYDLIPHTF
jgi:hypothetical protein